MNLDDVKQTLENDRYFYEAYLGAKAGQKYAVIEKYAERCCNVRRLSVDDKKKLRTYFNDLYFDCNIALSETEREELKKYRKASDLNPTTQQPAIQETTMSPHNVAFFETKHFLKGQELSVTSTEAIYQAIASKEADIKRLEAIENKPKSLIKQIEQGKADIKALVAYLDSKEAA